jgi:hypothetical protein
VKYIFSRERLTSRFMATPYERLYQLGERLLDVQERDVANLRSRVPALAAAAAVAVPVLAKPATAGGHPTGLWQTVSFASGIVGTALLVVALLAVLASRDLVFAVSPSSARAQAEDRSLMDDPARFDIAVAETLDDIASENAATIAVVRRWFAIALCGLMVEIAGLGTAAALAS